ncbi:hypothetical protein TrispH2_001059 [Trichoplax sp. H2]|nr:hypothetical protein TrispH2_001059 [Trichoplax sp. H2]|eukprot:RDD46810.1 hypothetical protein TrispH2_001059 [Trichoplax sp. H2]
MFRIGGKPDEAELQEAKESARKSVWFQAKIFIGTILVLRIVIADETLSLKREEPYDNITIVASVTF